MSRDYREAGPGLLDHPAVPGLSEEQPSAERLVANLRLLWENRRFILRATGWGLLASLLAAFALPSQYEAVTRLMPPENQSSSNLALFAALSSRSGGGLGGVAGDLLGLKTSGALFIGILRSQTVQDRLVQEFDLKDVYWKSLNEDARAKLAEKSSISEDRKSGIISIAVEDGSPERAAAIANAYVKKLNALVTELSTSTAHRERLFIEGRLQSVKADLDAAAKEFSEFASKNTAIDIREQGRAMVEAAATLQGQLIAAESELQGLRQVYAETNVRVRSVQARISELKRQLGKMGGSTEPPSATAPGAGTSGNGSAAPSQKGSESGTPSDGSSSYPAIRDLPRLGVTYADLLRRTKIHETVYELLTQQLELAKVQEAKETPSVKVLDIAVAPERRSFPSRTFIILFGTMGVFGVACIWLLGAIRWASIDSTVPGKELALEVQHALGQAWKAIVAKGKGNSLGPQ